MQKKFGLNVWRALAITRVLYSHWEQYFTRSQKEHLVIAGTDLFFVLSGFLIGQILLKFADQTPSLHQLKIFLFRRWFRTFPNYWLFLVINLWFFDGWQKGWGYLLFVRNFSHYDIPFFIESWSLAVQEWFYIIMPLLFLLCLKLLPNVKLASLLAIAFLIIFPLMLKAHAVFHLHVVFEPNIHKDVIYRLDSLAYGVLAAYVKYFYSVFWQKHAITARDMGIILLGLLSWLSFTFVKGSPFFIWSHSAFTAFALALLLPWADAASPTHSTLYNKLVHYISLWSYSLYLCHRPLFHAIARLKPFLYRTHMSAFERSCTLSIAWLAVCIAMSGLIYHFYEKPITRWRERYS